MNTSKTNRVLWFIAAITFLGALAAYFTKENLKKEYETLKQEDEARIQEYELALRCPLS